MLEPKNGPRKAPNKTAIIAAIVTATIILLVGTILIAAQFQSRLPATAFEFILLAATLGTLVGLSTVIYRVIQGPLPELPASVPKEMSERRKVRRAALFYLAAWLVSSAIFFKLRAGAGAFFSVFTSLLGLTILLTLYMVARRRDRNIALLLAQPWVRWEYDPEKWRGFAKAQADAGLRQRGRKTPRLVAGSAELLVGDKFLPWQEPGTYLMKVWRTPTALVFRFQVSLGKGAMTLDMVLP